MQKIINIVKKSSQTTKPIKSKVMVDGIPKYGSRSEVFHGNALMTTGKLTKNMLVKNKHGYIKSKRKVQQSKDPKTNPLLKMGLLAKKGSKEFGPNLPNSNNQNNQNNQTKSTRTSTRTSTQKSTRTSTQKSNRTSKKSKKTRYKFLGIF